MKKMYIIAFILLSFMSGCNKNTSGNLIIKETKVIESKDMKQIKLSECGRFVYLYHGRLLNWDLIDNEFILKIATFKGGNIENKKYTILVTFNRVINDGYPNTIKEVVMDELYNNDGINAFDFESIIPDNESKEALKIILNNYYEKDENNYLEYKHFYK